MSHNQFPIALRKRVRAFYYYRYQERYFNEENVLRSLSGLLIAVLYMYLLDRLV